VTIYGHVTSYPARDHLVWSREWSTGRSV